jgi:hypothetical protein
VHRRILNAAHSIGNNDRFGHWAAEPSFSQKRKRTCAGAFGIAVRDPEAERADQRLALTCV